MLVTLYPVSKCKILFREDFERLNENYARFKYALKLHLKQGNNRQASRQFSISTSSCRRNYLVLK